MTTKHIIVDQFGYRPGDEKVAIIVDPQEGYNKNDQFNPGKSYQVRKSSDSAVVFTGVPTLWNNGETDALSGDKAWWFDFSMLTQPGAYYVYDVENNVNSYDFRIGDDVYERVLYHALRMFYYQREAHKHEAPYAEYPWFDEASWVGKDQDTEARDVFYKDDDSRRRDISGGWMDAGDTNKYVTFINGAIHELLSTYETNPAFFKKFSLNIPESHLDAPDILSEIKWEMDWLIKMTNEDGSAHIKCGTVRPNPGFGMDTISPQSKDTTPRWYNGIKSSAAAIAVAGMFAHGAIVYKTIDIYKAYGEELAIKAEKSWDWYVDCLKNNTRNEKVDQGEIRSGNANRSFFEQDMMALAAAIYLFDLTGNEKYHDYIKANYKLLPPMDADMGIDNHNSNQSSFINSPRELGLGYVYYFNMPNADQKIVKDLQDKYVQIAMKTETQLPLQFVPEKSAYRAFIAKETVHWGHLALRGARGYESYILSELNLIPELSFNLKENAANQLHYIHGVNPQATTFLTNMYPAGASDSVKFMYHEWFMALPGIGMLSPPGYLVGGPNCHSSWTPGLTPARLLEQKVTGIQDPDSSRNNWMVTPETLSTVYAPARLLPMEKDNPPLKCYLDVAHIYGNVDGVYDGYHSYAWTEPMCAYQAAYVRLLACFVGKPSLPVPK